MDEVEQAKKLIKYIFGDTSVSPETTKERLQELADEIEILLSTL